MPFGVHRGSISRSNLAPKSTHKSIINHYIFPSYLRCHFGSILVQFSFQLASQNLTKSTKNRCHDAFPSWVNFKSIFHCFSCQLQTHRTCKIIVSHEEKQVFLIAFRSWHWFWNDLCSNMHPSFFQKSTKIFLKADPNWCVFSDNILHSFLESTCFHFPPPKSHLELVFKSIFYVDVSLFFQWNWWGFGSQHGTQKGVGAQGGVQGGAQGGPRKPQRQIYEDFHWLWAIHRFWIFWFQPTWAPKGEFSKILIDSSLFLYGFWNVRFDNMFSFCTWHGIKKGVAVQTGVQAGVQMGPRKPQRQIFKDFHWFWTIHHRFWTFFGSNIVRFFNEFDWFLVWLQEATKAKFQRYVFVLRYRLIQNRCPDIRQGEGEYFSLGRTHPH